MTDLPQNEVQVLVIDKTLDDYKKEFLAILEVEPNLSIRDLKKYDSHFKEATATFAFHNAKRGKTSYDNIRRIVNAANKLIAAKQATEIKPEQIRHRQRLIPS